MARPLRTRPVTSAQVRAFAAKAHEYVEAAANELEAGRCIAATSLAIHAAINAADAVCGGRVGRRITGEDHDRVLELLKQSGRDGADVARDLRGLLPLKTRTEYEPDLVASGIATRAVERAQRCVGIARAVAAGTR